MGAGVRRPVASGGIGTPLRRYGATALRRYGATALRRYGATALRRYGATALREMVVESAGEVAAPQRRIRQRRGGDPAAVCRRSDRSSLQRSGGALTSPADSRAPSHSGIPPEGSTTAESGGTGRPGSSGC